MLPIVVVKYQNFKNQCMEKTVISRKIICGPWCGVSNQHKFFFLSGKPRTVLSYVVHKEEDRIILAQVSMNEEYVGVVLTITCALVERGD